MSEHSDYIRRKARHRSGNCPQCTRTLAAADYLDELEARHQVLLDAAIGARDLIACYLSTLEAADKKFTTEVYSELTAAVLACEKTTAGCGAKACDDPPDLTRDNQSASQQL